MKTLGLFLAISFAAGAQTFRIAGVIVNSETAEPVAKAKIMLAGPGKSLSVFTERDGHFEFQVPAGKYSLGAEVHGMRHGYGRRSPNSDFGVAVVTGPDQKTDNLTFRWFAPVALEGTVTDQFGEPVEAAEVGLLRIVVLNGRKRVYFYGARYTDDRGQYYFGPFLPGAYYITITGAPWYSRQAFPGVLRNLRAPQLSAAYAAMYYPATHDARAAAPFLLKPGQEARADFTLDETHGANVNVHCEGGPATKTLWLMQQGVNGFQAPARQFTMYGKDLSLPAVAPGHYAIRISAGESNLAAWQEIDVSSADLDAQLTMKPAPSIVGTVKFQEPAVRRAGSLSIQFSYDVTGFVFLRTVASDGSFSVANLSPGRYQVRGISGDYSTDVVGEDGAPEDGYIDLVPGPPARVRVIATDATSRVKGFVRQKDQPRPGVLVVLAARTDSEKLASYRAFQTDSDGSFDIRSVRAGDYYLFAADAPELEWTSPAALRPYYAAAKTIHIDPHVTYDETLAVMNPPRAEKP